MTQPDKIIFLDIDGPMIPQRAYFMAGNHGHLVTWFDPVAVIMVNRLLALGPAKLIIGSTWRKHGRTKVEALLTKNGIDPNHLHTDWNTTDRVHHGNKGRTAEIQDWLDRHPETQIYVAIDDEKIDLERSIQVTFSDGIQMAHYLEAGALLQIDQDRLYVDKIPDSHNKTADCSTRCE